MTRFDLHHPLSLAPIPLRLLMVLAASLLCVVAVGAQEVGLGHAEAAANAAQGETPPPSDAADTAEPDGAEESEESEDGFDWLTEEETGREYRLGEVSKTEVAWKRVADDRVRFPGGVELPIAKEDEDTFWVVLYRPDSPGDAARKASETPEVSEEEKVRLREELEATYRFELDEVDRVRLEPFDEGLPRRGQWRNGFDLGDLNRDGHLDIVFAATRKGGTRPNVFLGDGKGTWNWWNEPGFPPAPYGYGDVVVADWNGDGLPDLGFGMHLRGLLVLIADPEAETGFLPWSEGLALNDPAGKHRDKVAAFTSRTVGAHDWNGDGRMDFLAYGEGPSVGGGAVKTMDAGVSSRGFHAYLNAGDGSWEVLELMPWERPNFGNDFELLDVDGDGDLDVLFASSRRGSKQIVSVRTDEGMEQGVITEIRDSSLVDALEVADFDEDGRDDLVVTYRSNELGTWNAGIDVLLRREDGWDRRSVMAIERKEPFRGLDAGDIDGDGHLDLAAVDDFGVLWILLGRGDGAFDLELTPESPDPVAACHGYHVEIHDFDGDGLGEIVAAFAGEPQGGAALAGVMKPGCPGGGALRAWTPKPATTPAEKPATQEAEDR